MGGGGRSRAVPRRRKISRSSEPVRSETSAPRECDPLTTVSPGTPAPLFRKYRCQAPSFKNRVGKNEVPAQRPLFLPYAALCWARPLGNSGTNKTAVCRGREERGGEERGEEGEPGPSCPQPPGWSAGPPGTGLPGAPGPAPAPYVGPWAAPARTQTRAGAAAPGAPPCLPAAAGDPSAPAASVVFGLGFLFKALPKWPPRTHSAQSGQPRLAVPVAGAAHRAPQPP